MMQSSAASRVAVFRASLSRSLASARLSDTALTQVRTQKTAMVAMTSSESPNSAE